MTSTRQVYSRVNRSRYPSSGETSNLSQVIHQPQTPSYPSRYHLNSPNRSHPSTSQLRDARINRFQTSYDQDKEAFLIKEKEKQQKKLMEKLKRHKGVGELGNRLSTVHISEEAVHKGFHESRESYQKSHDISVNEAMCNRKPEFKIGSEHISPQPADESGHKLGGSKGCSRARGDHPLLARLNI